MDGKPALSAEQPDKKQPAEEAADPIETVHAQLEDLKEHIDEVAGRLPRSGPVTLNRWRIIDGSLGELIDQIKGIRETAKEAKE